MTRDIPYRVPAGHPAIRFVLLLAIADDALGLIILAIFYPSGTLSFSALAVLMTLSDVLHPSTNRRKRQSANSQLDACRKMNGYRVLDVKQFVPAKKVENLA